VTYIGTRLSGRDPTLQMVFYGQNMLTSASMGASRPSPRIRRFPRTTTTTTKVFLLIIGAVDAFGLIIPRHAARQQLYPAFRPSRIISEASGTTRSLAAIASFWNEPPVIATAMVAGSACLGLQFGIQSCLYYFHQIATSKSSATRQSNNNNNSNNSVTANVNNNSSSSRLQRAHRAVALLLMISVSVWGSWGWFGSGAPTTAAARIWGENTAVSKLAAVLAGALILWDIPMSLVSLLKFEASQHSQSSKPQLWLLLGHHVVMATVAMVGATALPTHYGFFYLGVSEISTIPLILYEELQTTRSFAVPSIILDGCKLITAILFTLIRVLYFTKITIGQFCPDVWKLLRNSRDSSSDTVLWFMLTTGLAFTILQWYWFYSNILSLLWRNNKRRTTTTNSTIPPAASSQPRVQEETSSNNIGNDE
jgi:TLC domain